MRPPFRLLREFRSGLPPQRPTGHEISFFPTPPSPGSSLSATKELPRRLAIRLGGASDFLSTTRLAPNFADFWFALAAVCRDAGRNERARAAAQQALRADFSHAAANGLLRSLR